MLLVGATVPAGVTENRAWTLQDVPVFFSVIDPATRLRCRRVYLTNKTRGFSSNMQITCLANDVGDIGDRSRNVVFSEFSEELTKQLQIT